MYLAGNAHPELAFPVHQCARFTHSPRHSHTTAIKRIGRYLNGIIDKDQGLIFTPTTELNQECYVDADFAAMWGYADVQDPICV